MNETLIGAGIMAFSGLYLFLKLKEGLERQTLAQRKTDPFTVGFMVFAFALFLYASFLVGKTAIEAQDVCQIMPVNDTTVGGTSYYSYANVCFENDATTATGLFKLSNLMIIVSGIFLLVIALWTVVAYVRELYVTYK